MSHQGWLAAVGTNTSWSPSIILWGFNVQSVVLLIWPDTSILVIAKGKSDLGSEPLRSLLGYLLFAPLPGEPELVLGQLSQKVSFPGRVCRQKKSTHQHPHALKMFRRRYLHFVFDLNLSPGPTSQLGGSSRCPASETSDFCLSAKLVVLSWEPLQG